MKKSTLSCHELTKISENYVSNFKKKLMLLLFVGFSTIGVLAQTTPPTCTLMKVDPATLCPNSEELATASVVLVNPAGEPVTWKIFPNASGAFFVSTGTDTFTQTITADGDYTALINSGPTANSPQGGFTVTLSFNNHPGVQTCSASPLVLQPSCNITGANNVCPLSTNIYTSTVTGGIGATTHSWTVVSGGATINGSSTGETVSVTAAATCGTFTLRDTVTKGGCQTICEQTFTVVSSKPVIANCPTGAALGCNPTPPSCSQTVTASDNCGTVPVICTPGEIVVDGCNRTQTFTYSATNGCGLSADSCVVTYTWTVDTEKPVISAVGTPENGVLACNPTADAILAALGTATATDNCGAVTPTFTDGTISSDGCMRSQTRTWNVTDACQNAALPVSRTVTWKVDTEIPVITASGTPENGMLACNPTADAILAALGTATATDNCGPLTPTFTDGDISTDGCSRSQTRTWNVTDACNNPAQPVSRTVTWKVDTTPPVITCAADRVIECGGTISFTDPTATDNCSGEIMITVVGTVTNMDGSQTRTWKAMDACGNSAECSQTVSVAICAAEGCTLGYWKNHTDRWCSNYTTCMIFGQVFVNAPSELAGLTLLEALNLGGGGIYNLARQGVAALLNTCSDEVDYPAPYLNNPQSVIDAVNAAFRASGKEPGMLASKLDMLNNSGCPLGGTMATSAPTPSCNTSMKELKNEDAGKAGFELFPVPFKDQLNIRYKFDYTSDVKIEVFNSNGILMLTKADANGYLDKEIILNLNSSTEQEQVYVVKVTTNRGSSIKKVMSAK